MVEWFATWVNGHSCLLKPMLSFTRVVDKWQWIKLEENSLESWGHSNILAKQGTRGDWFEFPQICLIEVVLMVGK